MTTRKPKINKLLTPWTFNGKVLTQDDVADYAGFVYMITFLPTGQRYIGKKFFSGMRKQKGKKRRSRVVSDWEKYWSSSDTVKKLLEEYGPEAFKREIISLHKLKRDVNFCEVYYQFKYDVLTEMLEDGVTRRYFNDNIQGKYFPGLVIGWQSRQAVDESILINQDKLCKSDHLLMHCQSSDDTVIVESTPVDSA